MTETIKNLKHFFIPYGLQIQNSQLIKNTTQSGGSSSTNFKFQNQILKKTNININKKEVNHNPINFDLIPLNEEPSVADSFMIKNKW